MILYFYYALDYNEKNKKCDMISGMKDTSKIFRIRLVQYRTLAEHILLFIIYKQIN